MVWGSWKLGLWGLVEAVGLGGTGEFGIPSLKMGALNFGVPQKGNHYFKNREFSGNLASRGAVGHVGWASYKALGDS